MAPKRDPDWERFVRVDLLVSDEWERARAKHGTRSLDGPDLTELERLAALVEEVGEVAQLLTYDHSQDNEDAMLRELVQVANVAMTWATLFL